MATKIVPLSKPFQTHKGLIKELELNEPHARSFRTHNEPFKVKAENGGATTIEYDNKAVLGFLSDMSGHDALVLDDLPAADYYTVRTAVFEMLVGLAGENPTAP